MLPIICPVCHGDLTPHPGGYSCQSGHSFDTARQGYTNLLLSSSGGQHGDDRAMTAARSHFLSRGYYAPLKDALCRMAVSHMPKDGILLDAGCGEGYYTHAVLEALAPKGVKGIGIDISREALRAACRFDSVKNKTLSLFVAGVYRMPIADESVDGVLNFFAPLATEEYLRVLKPGGYLFMAIPAERHLWELKEVLYDTPYENAVKDFSLPGFELLEQESVTAPMTLTSGEEILSLVGMTPYLHRTPRHGMERLKSLDALRVTGRFYLLLYKKST